jgi:predicted dehydrogenase
MAEPFRIAILGILGHSGGYVIGQLDSLPGAKITAVAGPDGDASEILAKCREQDQKPLVCPNVEALLVGMWPYRNVVGMWPCTDPVRRNVAMH